MKAIKLPTYGTFKMKLDGTAYDIEAIRTHYRQYAANLQQVLLSAAHIEQVLKTIVGVFFVDDKQKRELFEDTVTFSTAFTFNEARRVVLAVLARNGMAEVEHKELGDLLQDVMNYRNELTHGSTLLEEDGKFVCSFFRSKKREMELNDAYWDKVQKTFDRTHAILLKLCFLEQTDSDPIQIAQQPKGL